jgi:hypothetical protein
MHFNEFSNVPYFFHKTEVLQTTVLRKHDQMGSKVEPKHV